MRWLILTQYFPPEIGASQVRLAALAKELERLGHDVEVVTSLPNYPTGRTFPGYRGRIYLREKWDGVSVHRVWLYPSMGSGFRRLANYLSFSVMALFPLLQIRRPDVVFVESPPLFLGLSGVLAAWRWRIPMILNVADLWPDSVHEFGVMRDGSMLWLVERLERWSYQRATFISTVTEGIQKALVERKNVPHHKVLFLPNGVDTNLFRPRPPDSQLARQLDLEGKRVALYAGTHGHAHGLGVALHAVKLLENAGIVFVFIGGGSEKPKLQEMAAEMSLGNVYFLDPAPPEYVARLYSLATIALSTLRKSSVAEETRPAKVLPAMASGKPVVYSGSGEGARLIEDTRAGLVVPPEDPKALADAILTLAYNPALADELGRNGRKYVEEKLTWSALVKDWLRQLEAHEGVLRK